MSTTLDELHGRVTMAILDAESYVRSPREYQTRLRHVSYLEEQIAAITDAETIEGSASRLGAVWAALSSEDTLHGLVLAERYLREPLPTKSREALQEMASIAEERMLREADGETLVHPVRFRLKGDPS